MEGGVLIRNAFFSYPSLIVDLHRVLQRQSYFEGCLHKAKRPWAFFLAAIYQEGLSSLIRKGSMYAATITIWCALALNRKRFVECPVKNPPPNKCSDQHQLFLSSKSSPLRGGLLLPK